MAKLTWIGHGTHLLETDAGTRILIDAFIDSCPTTPDALKGDGLGDLDAILITHGHIDHIADAVAHQQRTGASLAAIVELAEWFTSKGVDADKSIGFNKGGTIDIAGVKVTMTDAKHSSSTPGGKAVGGPAGFVIELENGFTVYHAGDTTVFGDMALIGELHAPDLAVLPIGDHYTMGPRLAGKAVELIGAKQVVGGHWGTFPALTGTPDALEQHVPAGTTVHKLQPGDSIDLTR
jgi:L-ascorbate metabolism protein UlaG (beta-lactamase superfamily)